VEAKHIGQLVKVEGIGASFYCFLPVSAAQLFSQHPHLTLHPPPPSSVTRATAVKPMMRVATYTCDACASEIYQEITGPSFMPHYSCTSRTCVLEKRKGRLFLQVRGSKFEKFQEIKIQEMVRGSVGRLPLVLSRHVDDLCFFVTRLLTPLATLTSCQANDVPTGHIPRTMTVYARGEVTRACTPGDQVTVTGIFLPVPYTGYLALRAGLLSDTFLEATQISKAKKTYVEQVITEEMKREIEDYANDSEVRKAFQCILMRAPLPLLSHPSAFQPFFHAHISIHHHSLFNV
jgi:DNA replication licensing factor MCM7